MKKMNVFLMLLLVILICSCSREADVASHNLSVAADQFQVERRIVFYNGITGEYMLCIEGLCSIGNSDTAGKVSITCKTGEKTYKKHFLGLSDNVTFFVEQIREVPVGIYHYKVIFRPESIVPSVDMETSNTNKQ